MAATHRLLPCRVYDRSCFQSAGVAESGNVVLASDSDCGKNVEGIWARVSWGRNRVYAGFAYLGTEHAATSSRPFYCYGRSLGKHARRSEERRVGKECRS